MKHANGFVVLFLCAVLVACINSEHNYAPVSEITSNHQKLIHRPISVSFVHKKPVKKQVVLSFLRKKTPNQKQNFLSKRPWIWPTQSDQLHTFSFKNKGIDISGQVGAPVFATADGEVVYAGRGLLAYGNLILIKHNDLYLSAYAHNQRIYVKEGDKVKKGQEISEMGEYKTNKGLLHFEIRHKGKPINPLLLLKPQSAV